MTDPVVTCDGHVYERAAIQDWFVSRRAGQLISPVTGAILPSRNLTAEVPLKRAIDEYLTLRPELQRVELDRLSLEMAAATLEEELVAKNRRAGNPQEAENPCKGCLLEAARAGDVQRVVQLIHGGYPWINEKEPDGCTALHLAARKGHTQIAFVLLDSPAFTEFFAVASIDRSMWTALELAVAGGHVKLAAAMNAYMETEALSAHNASNPSEKSARLLSATVVCESEGSDSCSDSDYSEDLQQLEHRQQQ